MSRRILAVASAIALTTLVSTSHAQSGLTVTPIIGVYAPSKPLIADSASAAFFETETAALYGIRIGYWFSPRIAVEGGFAMSPSRMHASSVASATDLKFKSTAKLADLRGVFLLSRPGAATGLHVSAGVAYTRASNALFDLSDEIGSFTFKTSIGGVVGLGVTRRLAAGTDLRVDFEDRIYKVSFDGSGIDVKDRTQQDFVFSAGLSLAL
jgi:hypothetical protein